MAHFLFFVLHVLALAIWAPSLFFTIPLHMIYAAVRRPPSLEITSVTHQPCPMCLEPVLKGARKCKHCGSQLNADEPV